MKINIATVHFNTPLLTECLVKSINKFVPECTIYIFDNSDKCPFTYRQDNIVYIDNTKGQIIDFDAWLSKYPDRNRTFCYSPKHCYTIDKLLDIIGEPFILLDSDVLLLKDITELYDENVAFVGEKWGKTIRPRVLPYICFLNPKMLKEYGVRYFDDKYIQDLNKGGVQHNYDTGYMLYKEADRIPCKLIRFTDYIVHYGGGSYDEKVFKIMHRNQISADKWLENYKTLWS